MRSSNYYENKVRAIQAIKKMAKEGFPIQAIEESIEDIYGLPTKTTKELYERKVKGSENESV